MTYPAHFPHPKRQTNRREVLPLPYHRKGPDLDDAYDKIYRYCYFKIGHRESAEDITQQTFLNLFEYEKRETIKNPLAFLYTVAGNLCMDEFRRRKREAPEENETLTWKEAEAAQGWEDEEKRTVLSMDVRSALKKLNGEEQELLLLRYANDLPVQEIGRLFHLSRFAVRRRLLKALQNLRKELDYAKRNETGSGECF